MPVRDRYRGANAGVQSRWGLAGLDADLTFSPAGMPSADGIGLAGVGLWPFTAAIATSSGGDTDAYESLLPHEQSQVDELVRAGVNIWNAIASVVGGDPIRTTTTVGAPRPAMNWTPILLLGGAVLLLGGLGSRRRR